MASSRPNTRIKVSREKLLQKLRAERAKIGARYERDMEKYKEAADGFERKLLQALIHFDELLKNDPVAAMKRVEDRGYGGDRGVKIRFPALKRPQEPKLDTTKIDRHIRVLEMAEDETLSISADDEYAGYL